VANLRKPGYHSDGNGLYLQVSPTGTKSWVFRYMLRGRAREMGLGPEYAIPLAEARLAAIEQRRLLLDGIDPIEARKARLGKLALQESRSITFSQCAAAYIETHQAAWKNAKHIDQWKNTIKQYCEPIFGAVPVADVDTPLVVRALEPIWTTKSETAGRLRGRIENILDWATVRQYRAGDNPARWRGHLDKLLAKIQRTKRIQHHPALPHEEIAAFVAELKKQDGDAALALEFLILNVARTGEVIAARPEEFDYTKRLWVIPGNRMKSGKEHRIPLTPRTMEIAKSRAAGEFLFPGRKPQKPMSNMAMLQLLERMGRTDITVHGFRTTFRTWAAERTNYPRELCEMALAHAVGNEVEQAYQRSDLFEKRRELMAAWADYVAGKTGKVIPLRSAGTRSKKV
jgi:integrase